MSFYGDNMRWFVARVVNSNDPEARGRVQIRIFGIHNENKTEISDADLPWADCVIPTTEGGISGIGKIPQIKPSATVFGIFTDGKTSQSPLVIGTMVYNAGPSKAQLTAASNRGQGREYIEANRFNDGIYTSTRATSAYSPQAQQSDSVAQRRLAAMAFFIDNGISATAAAGIVGNLQAESNLVPSAIHAQTSRTDTEKSEGIAQWNPAVGRLQTLREWSSSQGKDYQDFFVQCAYVLHELGIPRGTATRWNQNGYYFKAGQLIMKANTFEGGISDKNATWVFCRRYENPKDPTGKLPIREVYARQAYQDYSVANTTSAN